MAAKKKTKKKAAGAKAKAKKTTSRKAAPKKPAKRASPKKKTAPKKQQKARKGATSRSRTTANRVVRPSRSTRDEDLQGLSRSAEADSESVSELLDEGNAFEAGVVSGVERADNTDEGVRTREVPEDDVPEEYLDEQ